MAAPVAATRSRATLPIAVSGLGVISRGGKGDGGKGSSDGNEELHSVKKYKISIKEGLPTEDLTYSKIKMKSALNFFPKRQLMCWSG